MLGDYVLHHPITDFPVALLVIAALFQITCLVLKRPQWQVIADATLVVGFVGSLAAVGTGLWLVEVSDHGHSKALSIHHWFAYSALGVAAIATLALAMSKRRPGLAKLKVVALVISASLVSAAGFFGGKMAHPAGEQTPHTHGDGTRMHPTESVPHEHGAGEHGTAANHAEPTPTAGSSDGHTDHQRSTNSTTPDKSVEPKPTTAPSDGHTDHQDSRGSATPEKPLTPAPKPTAESATKPASPLKPTTTKPTTPPATSTPPPTPVPSTETPPAHDHHH